MNKDSKLYFIEKNKTLLPVSYYFPKEVKPNFVPYRYANSKNNNAYVKVGVYHKLISISFIDE